MWDEELGNVQHADDVVDKMRLEWRGQLDWLEIHAVRVMAWVKVEYGKWVSKSQALGGNS